MWVSSMKFALIVLGATFFSFFLFGFFFFFLFFRYSQVRERLDRDEAPPAPHRRISGTPANAVCYNDPAGVSVSSPTDDAICLLASATATAEPDSRNAVEEENCACGTLGLLERFGRPERRTEKRVTR